ncbi:hypothetical protein KKF91_01780 [Myxococcota bacterium]|nr:hypothetical protein [Myxococcota bacterium]MBU1429266.1 hypothetical protein [Myxococcota bacterium]MBU1897121.1 hypothetical protein [Myxococcota bacterium]
MSPPPPDLDLQIPARSAQIAALVARMLRGGARLVALSDRPLQRFKFDLLPSPPTLPLKFDPHFEAKPPEGARPQLRRPDELEAALGVATPQFTLRDTHRVTRYADPDDLEYRGLTLRDLAHEAALAEARRCHYERPELGEAGGAFAEEVAARRAVVIESAWDQHFGRADTE